jgi:hypothetical protein
MTLEFRRGRYFAGIGVSGKDHSFTTAKIVHFAKIIELRFQHAH